ncbi:helix-turn-helix domain-containing protein [Sinomicrobium weinanense]|uniref:Helix-turn-helix domain-containing protein n=1 Tax=Sinomicrobium weinanense TaxID=2842200 RepID=A0A926Q492_9FLAO|nr:helix-turn-helix domain-containing protein [Sinomicrobium weinanense]MBC9797709.1 helix-turn-helix domain-containing protein [Sinomicrobium weinanense]MBU3122265.1 helix-turn-helix domain-containing protein [Sinomicrobium weinanense]
MDKDHNKKRIESLKQMFLEVADGNFSYRIDRSGHIDDLEALVGSANMMGEALKGSLHLRPYVNYGESYRHVAEMSFILDSNFHIRSLTPQVFDVLLYKEKEMLSKPLNDFLMEESKPVWQDFLTLISGSEIFDHTLELSFKARQFFIVPATCLITKLNKPFEQGSMVVTTINTFLQSEEMEDERDWEINKKKDKHPRDHTLSIALSDADLEKIGKVQQYIADHLKESRLSTKELAHAIGTNEFKLKYGFKQLYGTTIFRYVQNERLSTAKLLVQNSELALKKIAMTTGFRSAAHFSRVFKEKYGHSPREFRKLFRKNE